MIRLLVAIFSRAPLRFSAAVSWTLAWIWWLFVPIRRKVAVENLQAALPELEPGPTLRRGFAELLLGYAELLRHLRVPLTDIQAEGGEPLIERSRAGKGSLILGGHGGAFDLCLVALIQQSRVPTSVLVRTPTSKSVAELLVKLRTSADVELLPPRNAVRRVMAALREGRMVVFVLDQRHNAGIPVPFFGRDAWTSEGLAILAARTGIPVYGVWQTREGLGSHRLRVYPPFELSGDPARDTALFSAFYEARIRERPHGWLWLHDRWRKP